MGVSVHGWSLSGGLGVSVQRVSAQGGLCPGGVCPRYGEERVVRILLECFFVSCSFWRKIGPIISLAPFPSGIDDSVWEILDPLPIVKRPVGSSPPYPHSDITKMYIL